MAETTPAQRLETCRWSMPGLTLQSIAGAFLIDLVICVGAIYWLEAADLRQTVLTWMALTEGPDAPYAPEMYLLAFALFSILLTNLARFCVVSVEVDYLREFVSTADERHAKWGKWIPAGRAVGIALFIAAVIVRYLG